MYQSPPYPPLPPSESCSYYSTLLTGLLAAGQSLGSHSFYTLKKLLKNKNYTYGIRLLMTTRFINCTACKGCHTGRGGKFCKFSPSKPSGQAAGTAKMSVDEVPERDSPEYASYLAEKIEEEEDRLKSLQDKFRITTMEEQLARLHLQTTEPENSAGGAGSGHGIAGAGGISSGVGPGGSVRAGAGRASETGVACKLLTAAEGGVAGHSRPVAGGAGVVWEPTLLMQRSKEDRENLSKLKALSHLSEQKPFEKITYREFVSAMAKVLKLIVELGIDPFFYIAHLNFITSKAALNLYATDALIRYEAEVTERVISGHYDDWVSADPECVALHLGADATYAVRQGGNRWSRQTSATLGNTRDFSDWPKEVCWLFNNTNCYFPRCKKAHICMKCKRTGHTMRECKTQVDSAQPTVPEVLSPKPQKEARKA